jgi:hypothetical protein
VTGARLARDLAASGVACFAGLLVTLCVACLACVTTDVRAICCGAAALRKADGHRRDVAFRCNVGTEVDVELVEIGRYCGPDIVDSCAALGCEPGRVQPRKRKYVGRDRLAENDVVYPKFCVVVEFLREIQPLVP